MLFMEIYICYYVIHRNNYENLYKFCDLPNKTNWLLKTLNVNIIASATVNLSERFFWSVFLWVINRIMLFCIHLYPVTNM